MAKVLPSLDESEPVHGDMETVLFLADVLKVRIGPVHLYGCNEICPGSILPNTLAGQMELGSFLPKCWADGTGFLSTQHVRTLGRWNWVSFTPNGTHTLHYHFQSFQKELGAHQHSVDSANTSGQQLVAEVLDDPTVTQEDMQEMNNLWSDVCGKSVQKQERIDEALEVHVHVYTYTYKCA